MVHIEKHCSENLLKKYNVLETIFDQRVSPQTIHGQPLIHSCHYLIRMSLSSLEVKGPLYKLCVRMECLWYR